MAILGQAAPDFLATDSRGQTHKLSDLKGKVVVLEWTNTECPYVHKFYDTNTMQTMQQDATAKGIIWFSVASSAKGREGYTDGDEANRYMDREKSHETARLLDPTGTLGHLYGATATPHMFVIDKDGKLVYAGAMDDQSSTDHDSLKNAHNYVTAALDDLAAGRQVSMPASKPYGCAVKY
jgi:peroxiredoxin